MRCIILWLEPTIYHSNQYMRPIHLLGKLSWCSNLQCCTPSYSVQHLKLEVAWGWGYQPSSHIGQNQCFVYRLFFTQSNSLRGVITATLKISYSKCMTTMATLKWHWLSSAWEVQFLSTFWHKLSTRNGRICTFTATLDLLQYGLDHRLYLHLC